MSTFEHASRTAALAAIPMALLYTVSALAQATKSVEVLAIVERPAPDTTRDGVREQFKTKGFNAGENPKWEYQSAQDSMTIAVQIVRKLIGDKPDTIVAIITLPAQAVVATIESIPVVYSGVTDPVAAQLVKSQAPTGISMTGMFDKLLLDKQITPTKHVVPNIKRVGMVYNPGEANLVVVVTKLKKLLSAQGMALIESAAPYTVDITPAVKNLIDEVDVVYTNTGNNVMLTYESLVKVANEAKIPLVANDTDSAKCGAIAALGISYYKLGQQTGKVVVHTPKGEKPGMIASAGSPNLELFVNESAAKKQGAILPTDLLKDAKEAIR